jgi:transcriptional regulator with XRE-family HTH domain
MTNQQIVYTFNPEMLIIGREIRGISQEELAGKIGISAKLQAAIEAGTFQPNHLMVSNYSDALYYPVPFFYSEGKRQPKEAWSLGCKHGGAE